ncbi:hypothetical protein TNIN_484931 [Trichonephila inaurata madagascariensis]|uniref:Uncharacterized protein n=1 Tax=Trichonephila inaurata madagascariensis TaxID=2747483 RepID=A0A8X7BY40_9ARAC|nr:hypothetical protein TNIN_484931 [Trichonephila inaurata madagascariensis]
MYLFLFPRQDISFCQVEHLPLPSAETSCSSDQSSDVTGHVMSDFFLSRSPGFCSLSAVDDRHQASSGFHVLTVKGLPFSFSVLFENMSCPASKIHSRKEIAYEAANVFCTRP